MPFFDLFPNGLIRWPVFNRPYFKCTYSEWIILSCLPSVLVCSLDVGYLRAINAYIKKSCFIVVYLYLIIYLKIQCGYFSSCYKKADCINPFFLDVWNDLLTKPVYRLHLLKRYLVREQLCMKIYLFSQNFANL